MTGPASRILLSSKSKALTVSQFADERDILI